jgi:hypothetical protein
MRTDIESRIANRLLLFVQKASNGGLTRKHHANFQGHAALACASWQDFEHQNADMHEERRTRRERDFGNERRQDNPPLCFRTACRTSVGKSAVVSFEYYSH